MTRCPVCWRPVWASERGRVERHADTAKTPCPMGANYLPDEIVRELQGVA